MGAPCPPHWSFAARAAYFGDRMCAFCDHRNPPGAKFCNDCASPLQLKPCNQCDAINDQAATNCYKCSAAYSILLSTSGATPVSPTADLTLAWATPSDLPAPATETQPLFAASAFRAAWRRLTAGVRVGCNLDHHNCGYLCRVPHRSSDTGPRGSRLATDWCP